MKKTFVSLMIFVAAFFSAQNAAAQSGKNYASFVILPSSNLTLSTLKKNCKATELWQPDSTIVQNTFQKMQDGIDSLNQRNRYLQALRPLSDYYFQVVGVVSDNRHKVIYFNACCSGENGDWTKSLYLVFDGGNCFFHIAYDLQDGKWKYFAVNGSG